MIPSLTALARNMVRELDPQVRPCSAGCSPQKTLSRPCCLRAVQGLKPHHRASFLKYCQLAWNSYEVAGLLDQPVVSRGTFAANQLTLLTEALLLLLLHLPLPTWAAERP